MSLKELTLKEHRFAEEQDFANLMMSGNIENYVYFHYLMNQCFIYDVLTESLNSTTLVEDPFVITSFVR